jgi:hypothetical protein
MALTLLIAALLISSQPAPANLDFQLAVPTPGGAVLQTPSASASFSYGLYAVTRADGAGVLVARLAEPDQFNPMISGQSLSIPPGAYAVGAVSRGDDALAPHMDAGAFLLTFRAEAGGAVQIRCAPHEDARCHVSRTGGTRFY